MNEEKCQVQCIHTEIIKKFEVRPMNQEKLERVATLFKVLGDCTRIRIIDALLESEMCVCDLAYALKMSQSSISHQLRVLRENQIVKKRREGKIIFYSLKDDHVRTLFSQGCAHIQHENGRENKHE